jgi:hypothetical protein
VGCAEAHGQALERGGGKAASLTTLLTGPTFLSGLTEAELAAARAKAESHLDPNIVQAREQTKKAMSDVEAGWKIAIDKIGKLASLFKGPDGAWHDPSMTLTA